MTTLNTIIEEEKKKLETICKQADQYQINAGYPVDTPALEIVHYVLTTAIQRAYETCLEDMLKEKIEGAHNPYSDERYFNDALDTVYKILKEELLELES